MSRTQDIVVARLRTVAARWWAGQPPEAAWPAPADQPGQRADWPQWGDLPAPADPPCAADADPAAPGAAGCVPPGDSPEGAGTGDAPIAPAGHEGRLRVWLALGALTCAGALVVAGGAVVRGWPRVGPEPVAAPTSAVGLLPFDAGAGSPSASPSVVVHVAGEVREPGVVTLPAGARVADAVRAAGGLRKGGRLGPTNLARVLADGERIEIGELAGGAMPGDMSGAGSGVAGLPVDLNTATAQQLDALPGIGPVTAAKILAWRAEHGRFSVVDELAEVPGIGPKTLEELRPHVRV